MKLVLYLLALLLLGAVGVVAIYLRFLVVLLCIAWGMVTHVFTNLNPATAGAASTGSALSSDQPLGRSGRSAA